MAGEGEINRIDGIRHFEREEECSGLDSSKKGSPSPLTAIEQKKRPDFQPCEEQARVSDAKLHRRKARTTNLTFANSSVVPDQLTHHSLDPYPDLSLHSLHLLSFSCSARLIPLHTKPSLTPHHSLSLKAPSTTGRHYSTPHHSLHATSQLGQMTQLVISQ
jgi:hypothetical protein